MPAKKFLTSALLLIIALISLTYSSSQNSQAQGQPIPLPGTRVLSQQTKIKLGEYGGGDPFEGFGASVAISEDGNTSVTTTSPYAFVPNQAIYNNVAYVHVRTGNQWTHQATLKIGDPLALDFFGSDSAISANGNTILIGSPDYDHNGTQDTGAVFVFVRTGTTWTQQAELQPSDSTADWRFGYTVSLSDDGNTAVITKLPKIGSGLEVPGAAYIFVRSGTVWTQQARLDFTDFNDVLVTNGQNAISISGDGNTVLVGAADGEANDEAVFVFTRSGTDWSEQTRLVLPEVAPPSSFGSAVDLSDDGNTAMIGAYNYSSPGIFGAGAAFFFTRSGTTWTFRQKLTASDASNSASFAKAVSLSSDGATALLSTPNAPCCTTKGKAYIFTRSGNTWTELVKYLPADNQNEDNFGNDAALSGDGNTALIGAYREDNIHGSEAGAAYVFVENGASWTEQAKLIAPYFPDEGERTDNFGTELALSADGNTALIFASDYNSEGQGIGVGRIYVRTGSTWSFQAALYKPDAINVTPYAFGRQVALSADGNTALVGIYVFVRSGTNWSFQQKFTLFPSFLSSVDLSDDGNRAIVGDLDSPFSSVWVFTRTGTTWGNGVFVDSDLREDDDGFGTSVALSGDGNYAVVGADFNGPAGRAFVFTRSGTAWNEQAAINPHAEAGNNFGLEVAINGTGDTIAVGSFKGIPTGETGVVSVFTRSGTNWSEQTHVTAGGGYYRIALSLSANGNSLLIGKPNNIEDSNFPEDPGVSGAYLYMRDGNAWHQENFIIPADIQPFDYVGYDVGISADGLTLLLGALGDDTEDVPNTGAYRNNAGAAYVYFEDGTIATETPSATPTEEVTPTTESTATEVPPTLEGTATETPVATETPADNTATPTPSITVTVTATATEIAANELVSNNSFELDTDANKIPDGWTQKNPTKDKLKCNKPAKMVAHSGECAYMFKGGAAENSKLVQKLDLTGQTFVAGETLDLSLFLNANNAAANGKAKVSIVYSDSTVTGKISVDLSQTVGYTEITGGYELASAAVQKIKVQLQNKSTAGKLFVDDISLTVQEGNGSRLIGLPGN